MWRLAPGGGAGCPTRVSGSRRPLVLGRWTHSTRRGSQSLALAFLSSVTHGCSHSRAHPDTPARTPWDSPSLAHSSTVPLTLPVFILTDSSRMGLAHAGVSHSCRHFHTCWKHSTILSRSPGLAFSHFSQAEAHLHRVALAHSSSHIVTLADIFTTHTLQHDSTEKHND